MQTVAILFGALFTIAVAAAAGNLLLNIVRGKLSGVEAWALAFLAGSACLSLFVFLFGILRIGRTEVFLTVGTAVIAAALWKGHPFLRGEVQPAPLTRRWRTLFLVIFCAFAAYYLVQAMAPEISPGGAGYHLGLVARYQRAHALERVTTSIHAMLAQGMEMLFWFAFAFGRHAAAALVHLAYAFALVAMIIAHGRRFGFPAAGTAAALLVFVSPIVGRDATVACNDLGVAAVVFGVYHLLRVWEQDRDVSLLVPVGLLAGFAYTIKYTAFLAAPYALGVAGWKLRRGRRALVRGGAIISGCALLMIAPWMWRNARAFGNPTAPFLNAVFPNPYVHVSFEKEYVDHTRHHDGLKSYAGIPLEVTVHGRVPGGLLGPIWLLAPVALLSLRDSEGRRLLLAAAVFGSTYFANIGTRFLIPSLPFIALAMALVLSRFPRLLYAVVVAHAVLSLPPVVALYASPGAWRLSGFPWRAALRIESEETYLARESAGYRIARMIEEKTPPGATVFTFNQVAEAYTTRRVMVAAESAFGEVVGGILRAPNMPQYRAQRRWAFSISRALWRKVRVVQTAEAGPDPWRVSEVRVFLEGKEIERSGAWRLRAWPNVWDVQMAFDNTSVTSWDTWQPAAPRMFIEMDFGQPTLVDEVQVDLPGSQRKVQADIQTLGADSYWFYHQVTPKEAPLAPRGSLRGEASRELRASGVTHLLVFDGDFLADDYRLHAREWRLRLAGQLPGVRLYEIQE